MSEKDATRTLLIVTFMICVLIASLCMICMSGCTLSFQNITTVGEASDIVDTEQAPDIKTDAKLDIPLPAL